MWWRWWRWLSTPDQRDCLTLCDWQKCLPCLHCKQAGDADVEDFCNICMYLLPSLPPPSPSPSPSTLRPITVSMSMPIPPQSLIPIPFSSFRRRFHHRHHYHRRSLNFYSFVALTGWVESLGSCPSVQLRCGHVFHYNCVLEKLRKQWPGSRIVFTFLECPLCKEQISHSSFKALVRKALLLKHLIQKKAEQVLCGCWRRDGFGDIDNDNSDGTIMREWPCLHWYVCCAAFENWRLRESKGTRWSRSSLLQETCGIVSFFCCDNHMYASVFWHFVSFCC